MKSLMLFFLSVLFAASLDAQQNPMPLSEFGLTFLPDYSFEGSNISQWKTMGEASWSAQDGEITGTSNDEKGGWLIMEEGYQDVGLHTLFQASAEANAGILLRMEEVDGGYQGVYLSLVGDDVAPYSVTLDNEGNIKQREKLRRAGGIMYRIAPPPDTSQTNRGSRGFQRPEPPSDLPIYPPNTAFRENDWNQIETFIETNVIRTFLNDGREIGGAVDGESALSGFGPIALHISGEGKVQFKDIHIKDISIRHLPKEELSPRFELQQISDYYYSWGTDAADFNQDGKMDIVAGPYIYFGPEFTDFKEIYPAIAVGPSKEFTSINHQFGYDVNRDGWPDVITGWTVPTVYINPGKESRRWRSYQPVGRTQSETTIFTDVDGDNEPELVYASGGQFRYAKPDPKNDTWKEYNVSEVGYALAHGIGTGDINGDGRVDVLGATGWWEQPAMLNEEKTWTYHPFAFGRYKNRASGVGGSVMAVFDVNGDGHNDVVSNLNAHGFGLAWFEQVRGDDGGISFVRHMISDDYSHENVGGVTFSQGHAATFADIDNDGVTDYIVGKRAFTHLDNMYDPDSYGPPVMYLYRTVRNDDAPGGAEFVPELIHNRSGAGSQITQLDLNDDGNVDIITSNNRGTFIFWNKGE